MRAYLRLVAGALTLAFAVSTSVSGAPAASAGPSVTSSTQAGEARRPPKIIGDACTSRRGVTVVVDFRTLRNLSGAPMNLIKIGCARGAQESGFTALLGAGFEVDPDSPFVCTIDDRPISPPRCPPPDGYWAYSHGDRGGDWVVSGSGAGDWTPPPGSLEGWSWAPYDKPGWIFPRIDPRDLFPS
jgi:hypothetical protein